MYKYAIASFMFIVMVCFLPGCVGIQTIYPDLREFARVCKEAREKGELVGISMMKDFSLIVIKILLICIAYMVI